MTENDTNDLFAETLMERVNEKEMGKIQ